MKKLILPLILVCAAGLFGQVSIGVRIGPPPPDRMHRMQPRSPGPDHIWVDGYWYADNRRWRWHEGYWTRAPYAGAQWMRPRYEGDRFFEGYWGGDRRVEHNHHWDRDRNRDYRR